MNRIILIGNGFDLAHGRKTNYADFILWKLKSLAESAHKNVTKLSDGFITIYPGVHKIEWDKIKTWNQFAGICLINDKRRVKEDGDALFGVEIKSDFLTRLILECCINRWVDFEREFYDELILSLVRKANLEHANKVMQYFISNFEIYLKQIEPTVGIQGYQNIFLQDFYPEEFVLPMVDNVQRPAETLCLNFNYTDTLKSYITNFRLRDKGFQYSHIHGSVFEHNNPIIMGFGDELDENYSKLENANNNEYLKYVKSFAYVRGSEYRNLLKFIYNDKYQVFILGHSCGLSDRTMLHSIFEHDNCVSIKIFHHAKYDGIKTGDNYMEISQEISRHFRNKQKFRDRLIPFNPNNNMPQLVNPFEKAQPIPISHN